MPGTYLEWIDENTKIRRPDIVDRVFIGRTCKVTMSHYGCRVTDLTLVGDSMNSAFRLSGIANKKLASEIVVCPNS